MTLTLFQRELDVWEPAAHNGTFRGNTPEFVTARASLEWFWSNDTRQQDPLVKGERITKRWWYHRGHTPRRKAATPGETPSAGYAAAPHDAAERSSPRRSRVGKPHARRDP